MLDLKNPVFQSNHWLILGRTGYFFGNQFFGNLFCGQVKLMAIVIGLHGNVVAVTTQDG